MSGLVFNLDTANSKSYPGSGNTVFDTTQQHNGIATTVSSTIAAPGVVFDYNTSTALSVSFPQVNKYGFTFSYSGRGTGIPISNYRQIFAFKDTNGYTYYYGDTRQSTLPYILHYVKDYALSSWATYSVENNTEYLTYAWHTFDIVVIGTTFTCYRDGALQGTVNVTQDLAPYTNITSLVMNGSGSNTFQIQFVRLYDRPLSAMEIKLNFNATKGRYGL
jgi:hypothetical protein